MAGVIHNEESTWSVMIVNEFRKNLIKLLCRLLMVKECGFDKELVINFEYLREVGDLF